MSPADDRRSGRRVLTVTVEHIADDAIRIVPEPETLRLWYGYEHHRTPSRSPDLPREFELHVLGLRSEESLELHLESLQAHLGPGEAEELLRTVFPTAADAPHGFGWEFPFGSAPIRSGLAWSRAGIVARIDIKYALRVFQDEQARAGLDPDIHLVPDP